MKTQYDDRADRAAGLDSARVVACEAQRMISKDEMMDVLLDACPSFAPRWEVFKDEWTEEADDLPHYLALADFARHLISLLERGEMTGLPAVFAAIERLHVEGDHYVQEAATVGILEALQNLCLHNNGTDPEQFRPYLGSKSARWWEKLNLFWQHGKLLTDD
jgi:hypothetical protein